MKDVESTRHEMEILGPDDGGKKILEVLPSRTRVELSALRERDPMLFQVGAAICLLVTALQRVGEWIDNGYRRKALLQAYRRRRSWRKADVAKLRVIGVTPVAERWIRQLEDISGRAGAGRGVVQYRPLEAACDSFFEIVTDLIDPATAPRRRLAALRRTPLCPFVTEAIYRGEHAVLKGQGARAASETAEQRTADAMGLSVALVRKQCTRVRRGGEPALRAATCADLQHWASTGDPGGFLSSGKAALPPSVESSPVSVADLEQVQ